MRSTILTTAGAVCLLIGTVPGCTIRRMGATQTDQELRATIAEHFPPGITVDEVHAALNELGVSKRFRMVYPRTESRPLILLVRMFYGGFWVDRGRHTLKWADASYVFDGQERLDRVLLYRDRMEYYHGAPLWGPTRPTQGPLRRFPAPIPPPVDPLEGAT